MPMEIKTVVLLTKELAQMKKFYIDVLGFSLLNEDKKWLSNCHWYKRIRCFPLKK